MKRFAPCLTTLAVLAFGEAAVAQSPDTGKSACYEVIPPQPNAQPRTPMLVDRCSGRTWLLAKSGRSAGYRWVRVTTDDTPPPSPGAAQAKAPPSDARNCFTFNNRRFCE